MITHNQDAPELIPNPINMDRAIQEIQVALREGLPWLSRAYGRARAYPEMLNGKRVTFPKVYYGEELPHEYKNVLMNDTVDASCWFQVTGPDTPLDYTHLNSIQKYQVPIALIFWFDIDKVRLNLTSEQYIHTELIKREIHNIINKYPNVTIIRVYDEDGRQIFREYTTDEPIEQYLMHPKQALRFEILLTYDYDCSQS